MYLINLRADGMKENAFSSFEKISRFDGSQLEAIANETLMGKVIQKNILVIIHGFNNSKDDILYLYDSIEDQCKTFFDANYDAIVGFIWPSGESELSYFRSKENARQSGRYLRNWLHRFTKAGCTIDVMGHSMATMVGYHALQSPKEINIRNIFSLGAAVSQSYLVERMTPDMMNKIENLYLFYTKRDKVLKYWFRFVEWREAVGYAGLEKYQNLAPYFHQLTLVDCSNIVQKHTGYWQSKVIFEFINNILDGKQYPRQYKLLPGLRNLFDSFLTSASKTRKGRLMSNKSANTNDINKMAKQNMMGIYTVGAKVMPKSIWLVLIAGMVIGFTGCSGEEKSDAYGQFEATETTISSEVGGKLLEYQVEEGDRLDKAQPVGLIDTTRLVLQERELKAKLESVQSQIANINAQVEVRKEELALAKTNLERIRAMRRDKAATAQQLDDANSRVQTIRKQIDALQTQKQSIRAETNATQARIEQVQDQLNDGRIINPVKGTVLTSYVEPYELVQQGQPLYQIANLDTLELKVYISGAQLPSVKIGQNVQVLVDSTAETNQQLDGKVSWISSEAEFTPKMIQTKEERVTQVYAVKVRVPNRNGVLKIGMPGEVNFRATDQR